MIKYITLLYNFNNNNNNKIVLWKLFVTGMVLNKQYLLELQRHHKFLKSKRHTSSINRVSKKGRVKISTAIHMQPKQYMVKKP